MLKNVLRTLVYVFLEIFYEKMIKQLIMLLTTFYIFYKINI